MTQLLELRIDRIRLPVANLSFLYNLKKLTHLWIQSDLINDIFIQDILTPTLTNNGQMQVRLPALKALALLSEQAKLKLSPSTYRLLVDLHVSNHAYQQNNNTAQLVNNNNNIIDNENDCRPSTSISSTIVHHQSTSLSLPPSLCNALPRLEVLYLPSFHASHPFATHSPEDAPLLFAMEIQQRYGCVTDEFAYEWNTYRRRWERSVGIFVGRDRYDGINKKKVNQDDDDEI